MEERSNKWKDTQYHELPIAEKVVNAYPEQDVKLLLIKSI